MEMINKKTFVTPYILKMPKKLTDNIKADTCGINYYLKLQSNIKLSNLFRDYGKLSFRVYTILELLTLFLITHVIPATIFKGKIKLYFLTANINQRIIFSYFLGIFYSNTQYYP